MGNILVKSSGLSMSSYFMWLLMTSIFSATSVQWIFLEDILWATHYHMWLMYDFISLFRDLSIIHVPEIGSVEVDQLHSLQSLGSLEWWQLWNLILLLSTYKLWITVKEFGILQDFLNVFSSLVRDVFFLRVGISNTCSCRWLTKLSFITYCALW